MTIFCDQIIKVLASGEPRFSAMKNYTFSHQPNRNWKFLMFAISSRWVYFQSRPPNLFYSIKIFSDKAITLRWTPSIYTPKFRIIHFEYIGPRKCPQEKTWKMFLTKDLQFSDAEGTCSKQGALRVPKVESLVISKNDFL